MISPKANKPVIVLNVVCFVAMATVNGLANTVRIGGRLTGEIADSVPNLFVPAGLTFAVWGVIYLLLLGFTVFQARGLFRVDDRLASRLRAIGVLFIVSCALNAGWIFAWHYLLFGLSLAVMLALLVCLIVLYLRLNADRGRLKPLEYLFLRLPFSVYLGWISVAAIANVTAVLVAGGWDRFGASEAFWAVFMIGVALALNILVLFLRRDAAYSLVFAWAFLGIYLKRVSPGTPFVPEVADAALVALIVTCAAVVVSLALRAARNARSKPVLP
ncbi:MAG: hypothetical protein JXD23_01825 [Spirochaetales bacterium]|nr:hypothetical protein [Spirochaetales bacterium]